MGKQRNQTIQIFRGLAIIAVVLVHTCPSGEWQVVCRPFINFAVATFLFLSGFLTKTDNSDWPQFFKKRIGRVIIPYAIWTLLYCITSKSWSPQSFLLGLVAATSACTMYYIFVYIQFVLLTPWLGKLARSKYQWLGWVIAPISTIVFKYVPLLSGTQLPTLIRIIWDDACLGWFTYYYLGLILGNKIIERNYNMKNLAILYVGAIIISILEGYWWFQLGVKDCGTQLKLSSFLSSSICLLMMYTYLQNRKANCKGSRLKLIGDYSFGIYLSHIMFIRILRYVPYYSSLPYVINSAIILLVSFLFVYCGNKICGPTISRWMGFK